MGTVNRLLARPRPPGELTSIEGLVEPDRFAPAPELLEWVHTAYLDEDGALYTEEHAHLGEASIGCLWTNAENTRRGRRVVGQAELVTQSIGRAGKWAKGRAFQQLREWFGSEPDFLLTFDAVYADEVDDASFCALVDHELFHCGQAVDEYGEARFSKATGLPIWTVKGHDVEEFTGVVRRFGIEAAGQNAADMVIAAAKRPQIAKARIAQACGTCMSKAA